MEIKKIIKNTFYLVWAKLVQFLFGIFRTKLAAIFLGTTGIGIYSQVNYITTTVSNLTLLSMSDGLVKQISSEKEKENFSLLLGQMINVFLFLVSIMLIIVMTLSFIFSDEMTVFFLGDLQYKTYFFVGLMCVPIAIYNSVSFSLLKSFKATRQISGSFILSSFITFIAFIPLVIYLGITGAVASIFISFLALFIINQIQVHRSILRTIGFSFRAILKFDLNNGYIKELMKFAFFGLSTGIVIISLDSAGRSYLINQVGIDQFGLYSPVSTIGSMFTGFLLPSLNIYLFPRYSECKSNFEINGLINDYLRLITFVMIPFLAITITFNEQIIKLFYTNSFIEASEFLPWHFVGLLFYMWWYPLALVMTPTGRIKIYSILLVISGMIDFLIIFAFVPRIGLYGWMLKFIISPVIFFLFMLFYLSKVITMRIIRSNLNLMLFTLGSLILLILIDDKWIKYSAGTSMLFLSLFFLSKKEKDSIVKYLRTRLP